MTVIPRLFSLYEAVGLRPITGHSPFHMFNWRDAPFTRFLAGNTMVGCAGLSLAEVMFVEHLRDYVAPRSILVVGNAHGWSTLLLALLFPEARVVAMDIDEAGIELTNRIVREGGLNAVAVASRSPEQVSEVMARHGAGPVDLALIDAEHTNDAIKADFAAVAPLAAPDATFLFHDVINLNMVDGFQEIARANGRASRICTRTTSGIALLFDPANTGLARYLDCFSDDPDVYREYRRQVLRVKSDPIANFVSNFERI